MKTVTIHNNPVELLQTLLRFNTTNPPGHELACVQYINTLLQEAGIETMILAKDEQRPNLVARLAGRGAAPPLLLQGHIDVVTTAHQAWQHDPFAGHIADGFVWGRGTLDMKGGVAMMVAAFLRAKAENVSLPGDVILTILSDEEAGGALGARFLVEEHPELFKNVQYALGEFGGFSIGLGGRRFYPIMVAEKQRCRLQLTINGPGGHGSLPIRGGAMARLATVLKQIDENSLPVHITDAARLMFDSVTRNLPLAQRLVLGQITKPLLTDQIIKLLGERGRLFLPLFHNTVSPNIVTGGEKLNVIPSEILLNLDGRLLPGFTPDVIVAELQQLIGNDIDIEVSQFEPGPSSLNMGYFETLANILREADPAGVPIPYLLSGVTDARYFAQLGIQTYGFVPMKLPPNFKFAELLHAADERIPVAALEFGSDAIYKAIQHNGVETS